MKCVFRRKCKTTKLDSSSSHFWVICLKEIDIVCLKNQFRYYITCPSATRPWITVWSHNTHRIFRGPRITTLGLSQQWRGHSLKCLHFPYYSLLPWESTHNHRSWCPDQSNHIYLGRILGTPGWWLERESTKVSLNVLKGLSPDIIICNSFALEDPGFLISHLHNNGKSSSWEGAECQVTLASQSHHYYLRNRDPQGQEKNIQHKWYDTDSWYCK